MPVGLEPAVPIECVLVNFLLSHDCEKDALHYRWSICFKTPGPGEYVFTVTGVRADGKLAPQTMSVQFAVEDASIRFKAGVGYASINYPVSNQDITLEASNFSATGDLIDEPLALLEFKDSNGNVIQPLDVYADCLYLQFWIASYPPLAPGVYSLHVEDVKGNSAASTGIYVGP